MPIIKDAKLPCFTVIMTCFIVINLLFNNYFTHSVTLIATIKRKIHLTKYTGSYQNGLIQTVGRQFFRDSFTRVNGGESVSESGLHEGYMKDL